MGQFRDRERSKRTRTIAVVVIHPLSIEYVVHGDYIIVFTQSPATNTSELLHVTTDTK